MDKYGRAVAADADANDLKRYYRIASPEAGKEGDEQDDDDDDKNEDEDEDEDENDEDASEEEDEAEGVAGGKGFVDYARGEQMLESSDEETAQRAAKDQDDDESELDSSDSEGSVMLGGASAVRRRREARSPSIDLSETERPSAFPDSGEEDESEAESEDGVDPTRRMAIVNMDWDHLRAADLYRVLASSLSATAVPAAPPKQLKPGKAQKFDADGNQLDYKPSSRLNIAKGRLLNLRIYPSKFGAERLEREAREGPPTEVFAAKQRDEEDADTMVLGRKKSRRARAPADSDDDDNDVTEKDLVREQVEEGGDDYDGEALRKYQLERLRYYYAIATFDSAASSAHVFAEINGTEFERTANMFDLQYVPDDTSFEEDPIHDEATEASIAAEGVAYKGIDFSTDALRHSKVTLTWDADDPHRKNKLSSYLAAATDKTKGKKPADVDEAEIRAFIASSSDEDGDEDDADEAEDEFFESEPKPKSGKRDKLRNLFGLDGPGAEDEPAWDGGRKDKKGAEGGMQITFQPALSEKAGKERKPARDDDDREETAIETYKRKENERRERRRAEWKAKKEGKTLAPEGQDGPEFGGEDTGPGGFDDDFFSAGAAGGDPFAAYDAGDGADSGDEIGLPKKAGAGKKNAAQQGKEKLSKAKRKKMREAEELANKQAQAELALLVGSDEEGEKHFDMKHILKAEKLASKGKKGRKGKKGADEDLPVNDDFEINVADDRFKSLHEDYDYAIDPSNPK